MILECLSLEKCYGLIVILIAILGLAVVTNNYMEHVLKYKKIGIVLDEIYKERFEGKESKQ